MGTKNKILQLRHNDNIVVNVKCVKLTNVVIKLALECFIIVSNMYQ